MTDLQTQLLAAIVRDPGCWTARQLAGAIDPPHWSAFVKGPADYKAWRGAATRHRIAVQRALSRLQQQGMIERQRPPRLADWFAKRMQEIGYSAAARKLHGPVMADGLEWPGDGAPDGDDVDAIREIDTDANAALLVYRLSQRELSARELLGPGASGALRRAYAWLCDEGAIESPSLRWPTRKGIETVEPREK